uniref:Uncharacterized protein n=1 Tax=Ixodes ricinus TaxID=34613 RepID=A0A6B0UC62_IXORI
MVPPTALALPLTRAFVAARGRETWNARRLVFFTLEGEETRGGELCVRAQCEKRTHAQCTQLVERESGESNVQLLERGKEESCACVVRVRTTTPRDIDPSKRCSASNK